LGRIYQESKKYNKAIEYFNNVFAINSKESDFLCANSSLQLGFIYKKMNLLALSKLYFNKVFEYKNYNSSSKNYFQQQAKAALSKF
jgi:tetratricopeptide (TPR) repeat protein